MLSKIVDPAQNRLLSGLLQRKREVMRGVFLQTVAEMNRDLGLNPRAPVNQDTVYSDLSRCREYLEQRARQCAKVYTELEWIWYLRRVSVMFEGDFATTRTYDLALAETLAAIYGASPKMRSLRLAPNVVTFDVSPKEVRKIFDLYAITILLSNTHSMIKLCGKGSEFEFGPFGLLSAKTSPMLGQAVTIYDERIAGQKANLLQFAGTVGGAVSFDASSNVDLFVLNPVPDLPVKVTLPTGQHGQVFAQYAPFPVSLSKLADLLERSAEPWWHPASGALLTLLMVSSIIFNELTEISRVVVWESGYVIIDRVEFQDLLDMHAVEFAQKLRFIVPHCEVYASAELLLSDLSKLKPKLWPLQRGNPIIEIGDNRILIDILGASSWLPRIFEYPSTDGGAGNVRAQHFEKQVQQVISLSPCAPPPELQELRGRTLELNNDKISDIDALAVCDNTLLIIDCISLLHDSEYETGHPSRVKNASDKLNQKLEKWQKIVETLNENKRGDNYDFSNFEKIVGIVCSPQPFFVPIGACTVEAFPGLRSVASANELYDFCMSGGKK